MSCRGPKLTGATYTPPLDAYTSGLVGAYCIPKRLLSSYTGPLIRVRSSAGLGTTEQDIGADSNGDLDTAALAAFIGSNSGYVVYVYDQVEATAGWDLGETTASKQPMIVNAGTLITLGTAGKPAALIDAVNDGWRSPEKTAYTGNNITLMSFCDRAGGLQQIFFGVTKASDRVDATVGAGLVGGAGSGTRAVASANPAYLSNGASVRRTTAMKSDGTTVYARERTLNASAANANAMNYTRTDVAYYQGTSSWNVSCKWNFGAVWESALSNGDIDALIATFDTLFGYE